VNVIGEGWYFEQYIDGSEEGNEQGWKPGRELDGGESARRWKTERSYDEVRDDNHDRCGASSSTGYACTPRKPGLAAKASQVRLSLACGKIKNDADGAIIRSHCEGQGWDVWDEPWLRERLRQMAEQGYDNQVSAVLAKLPPQRKGRLIEEFKTSLRVSCLGGRRRTPRQRVAVNCLDQKCVTMLPKMHTISGSCLSRRLAFPSGDQRGLSSQLVNFQNPCERSSCSEFHVNSLGTAGGFSPFHWCCGGILARLPPGRDVDLLHHVSARATRTDPALYFARRQDLKLTPAIARFTLPPLTLLKSHQSAPRRPGDFAHGDCQEGDSLKSGSNRDHGGLLDDPAMLA
jgi:hypothetical protein